MMPPLLSIDYGTSNTVAVLRRSDGQLRPLLFGASPLLPSGVHARPGDGELFTGHEAARRVRDDPAGYEPYPKRRIDDGEVLLGNRSVAVQELMAATLATVTAEAARVAGAVPSTVVITHPATWGGPRKGLLLDAADRAGLPVPWLVPEPVAASAHFTELPQVSIRDGQCLAVFDLGAGTFDVTVVRRTETGFEVVVSDGLDDVGGADLDEVIIRQIAMTASAAAPEAWRRLIAPDTAEDRRQLSTLREIAKDVKESLSTRSKVELRVPLVERDMHMTRAEFDGAAKPLLKRTVDMTQAVIGRSGIDVSELKGLFLVGGASRIPLAATLLHRGLGVAPTVLDQPELVVAEGGIAYARLAGTAVTDGPVTVLPPMEPAPPPRPAPPPPATTVAETGDPVWSEIIEFDFLPARRRVVWQGVTIIALAVFGLFAAMDMFVVTPYKDFPKIVVIVLTAGLVLVAGIARYVNAPDRYVEFGLTIDADGIEVSQDALVVAWPWLDITALGLRTDGRLAVFAHGADYEQASYRTPGFDIDAGQLSLGPVAPELWEELAPILEHYAGSRFTEFADVAQR